ncbi:MAG: hypothetical protein HFJ10_12585 [Lachnospiraceae bacterium]|nr:hypothetical protein [Lachnospiraceae bacterium]
MIQKKILGGIIFVSCYILIQTCSSKKEQQISIDKNTVIANEPIELTTTHIRHSDISSCTWYVGKKEVSRGTDLVFYKPSEEDAENFIRVLITLKDGTSYEDSVYFSTLPVMYIESEISYENVRKEEYTSAFMRLTGDKNYLPSELYHGKAEIHLRGNTTSELTKRPFKLKLEEKTNLLGLGETKHWVLLANAIDSTLLRNKLVYDFSGDIGADCHMNSENVTLIYNGEYQGVYQLCEQVRVGESSVNIFDWEDIANKIAKKISLDLEYEKQIMVEEQLLIETLLEEDLCSDFSWMKTHSYDFPSLKKLNETEDRDIQTNFNLENYINFDSLPDPTGGVLLEMDFYHKEDANLKTCYSLPIYYNEPFAGDTYSKLNAYIREQIQVLEYALHDTDFTYHNESPHYQVIGEGWFDWQDSFQQVGVKYKAIDFYSGVFDGVHYSELIDMDSLIVNFLVCEFTVNWDSMKNSVFLYKDIEGPFYISPAWDYDWAWGNSNFGLNTWDPKIWQTTDEFFANEEYYQTVQWNRYLIRDPYFLTLAYEKYWQIRDTVIEDLIRDSGKIDQYAEKLKLAADANDEKWGGSMGSYEGQKFDEGIDSLKSFMKQRVEWLDLQFASVETLRSSLGYYMVSDDLAVEPVDTISQKGMNVVTVHVLLPENECTEYPKSMSFQLNGTHFYTANVVDGTAKILIPDCDLREEKGALNTVQVRALDEKGEYMINPEGTVTGDYRNGISNYVCFLKDGVT